MKFNNSPIGIFDSGLGGLTVFKEIRKILPFEDLIYFGDTARVPYGNKSKETIIKYSSEILGFLTDKKIKIAIVACNTSSSLALDYLRKISPVPIFGVIEPGAQKSGRSFYE
jgi:Glutamate racemase